MEFLLIRHGQSQSNAGLTTDLDSHLTPLGQAQAEATARALQAKGVDANGYYRAFASPFRRTLETLGPLHRITNVPSEIFPQACEYFSDNNDAYKTFQGLSLDEIARLYPYASTKTTFPCDVAWWPKAQEDALAIYRRVSQARDVLLEKYAGTEMQIIIFSHADTIGRMTEALQRIPPRIEGPMWPGNCGMSLLRVTDPQAPAEIVFFNDTSHLKALGLETPA